MSRSLHSFVVATLVGFSLSATTAARAEETVTATAGLTESRMVAIAVREAPSVTASRHEAEAAEDERTAADRARLPDVVVTGRYTRLSSLPERFRTLTIPAPDGSSARFALPQLLDHYAARVALIVPLSDAWLGLAANARALGHAALAKQLELEATRARTAYEARAAFLLYRRAHGARRVAETALDVATAHARDQGQRVLAGTAPGSSALTFETAKNAAFARLRLTEAEVIGAEATVRRFLPTSLASVPLALDEGNASPQARSEIGSSPTLRAAETAVRAADARADAEKMAMLPRLSVVAGVDVTAPNERAFAMSRLVGVPAWDVTLQIEWSLSSVTVGSARRDRAVAERESLRARAEEVRRQLEAERISATATRASAEARVAASRHAVATATTLAEARRNELAAGAATPLDVTNAETERVRAELEQTDAELELRLADARLAFVAGWVPPGGSK